MEDPTIVTKKSYDETAIVYVLHEDDVHHLQFLSALFSQFYNLTMGVKFIDSGQS